MLELRCNSDRIVSWFLCLLLGFFMLFSAAPLAHADNYSTADDLGIGVTIGRITALQIGDGNEINFGNQTGGFYVRDYTPGPDGLPQNLDGIGNLLRCSDFDETSISCEDGLRQQTVWKWSYHEDITDPQFRFLCTDLDISPTGQTTVAELKLPKNLSGGPHYIGIYQDIVLTDYPNPSPHDLFCFSFDLATACGFRASGEVEDDTDNPEHRIIARVDWFASAGDMAVMVFKPELEEGDIEHRIGTTEADVWETTNSWSEIPDPYEHPTASSMTACGIRSYRPLNAHAVRVGVIVYGFLPNDGVTDPLDDHAYFDNFAFYKAPDMIPVRHDTLLDTAAIAPLVKASDGTSLDPSLQMGAKVTVETSNGRDYLLIKGKIVNTDDDPAALPQRALDLGFSFPVHNHSVTWLDDIRSAENVYANIGGYPAILPFRMTGPVDLRPERESDYQAYRQGYPGNYADIISQRAEGTTVSVYPFSAVDIGTTEGTRGLAFGDDLGADTISVSHFGYRVIDNIPLNRTGEYYVEFHLGVLEEGTKLHPEDVDTIDYTPFSFILFRCDDPDDATNSDFRIAADDYQADIFQTYFTRPEPPISTGPEIGWDYGGGFYEVKVIPDPHNPGHYVVVPNVFTNNADKFGLRYTQEAYSGDSSGDQKFRDLVDGCNDIGISTLVYNRPWQARFSNDPSANDMNHFHKLIQSRDAFGYPGNPIWDTIYTAQKEYQLKLPGSADLFCRNVSTDNYAPGNPLSHYYFPVLLADSNFGNTNLLLGEMSYMTGADQQIGQGTLMGLKGITLDNVFHGMDGANHLHFHLDHLKAFVGAKQGTLTYSINHLQPAIPQLASNVFYLDMMSDTLEEIDDQSSFHGDGTSGAANGNIDWELISVNANNPQYGGSKHGIMRADIGGFESSVDGFFNRRIPTQNFRRTVARDKSISRLIKKVLFSHCMTEKWSSCESTWDNLFVDRDTSRRQVMYEASWIALAWGFMPSVTEMFEDADPFYQSCIAPGLFLDHINHVGRSITNIFRELHLAGWRPRTKADVVYDSNPSGVDLFVERFGDSGLNGSADGEGVFFTVLNNDDLTLTQPHLAKLYADGEHAKKPLEEIESEYEFEQYEVCEKDFECIDFPDRCPDEHFAGLQKSFWLYIKDASELGFMTGVGNIVGRQLVYRPPNNACCNWSYVRDWQFTDGGKSNYYSIWRSPLGDQIRIGGTWPDFNISHQQPLPIDHTVLYVFKFWLDNKVDNGRGESSGESRTGDGSGEDYTGSGNPHYERYGASWRTFDTAGYNGTVDVAAVDDPEACAYYTIGTGVNGPHDVLAHFPVTAQAATAARFDMYVVDYLEGPAREAILGEPELTTVVDQSDDDAYSTAADQEGFITLGTVDVSVAPGELKTIVIKLSPARDDETSWNPSTLLVSDAVMIREAE